jgi:hypothetical protein
LPNAFPRRTTGVMYPIAVLLNIDKPLKRATLHNEFCAFVPKRHGTVLKPVGQLGRDGGYVSRRIRAGRGDPHLDAHAEREILAVSPLLNDRAEVPVFAASCRGLASGCVDRVQLAVQPLASLATTPPSRGSWTGHVRQFLRTGVLFQPPCGQISTR